MDIVREVSVNQCLVYLVFVSVVILHSNLFIYVGDESVS